MNISPKLTEFLQRHKKLINENRFYELYSIAEFYTSTIDYSFLPQMTSIFLLAGMNPLQHMKEVPVAYLAETSIDKIMIPEGIQRIRYAAFKDCSELKEVYLPNSLVGISDMAFYGCSSLSKLVIMNPFIRPSAAAFLGVDNINEITYNGTIEQWSKLKIKNKSNNVICTDGIWTGDN